MASVCFYFQVHQPYRLRRYSVFDTDRHYLDEFKNAELCRKVAQKCYLPADRMLLDTIREHEGKFRLAFSLTGVALEQFQQFVPEVIEALQELAPHGASSSCPRRTTTRWRSSTRARSSARRSSCTASWSRSCSARSRGSSATPS